MHCHHFESSTPNVNILWMEEILHHLEWLLLKPYKSWDVSIYQLVIWISLAHPPYLKVVAVDAGI